MTSASNIRTKSKSITPLYCWTNLELITSEDDTVLFCYFQILMYRILYHFLKNEKSQLWKQISLLPEETDDEQELSFE